MKCRKLVSILEKIETKEELLKEEPVLNKKFREVVDLTIAAKRFQEKSEAKPPEKPNRCKDALKVELERIYNLNGGREVIERATRESLTRVSLVENKHRF